MTPFELFYLGMEPFLPHLHAQVRRQLLEITKHTNGRRLQLLDVGGRKSNYTIGVPADVTITDLPRQSDKQHALRLGITDEITKQTKARRTNIARVELDDMTRTELPEASFDCVVSVEVLEHVVEDEAFVRNVARVLRPGGVFLMTTPNGDYKPVPDPRGDHKRHYRRAQLAELLGRHFVDVDVEYAVVAGRARQLGLHGLSPRHPVASALSMAGNLFNSVQSTRASVRERAQGTHHLIATARKA